MNKWNIKRIIAAAAWVLFMLMYFPTLLLCVEIVRPLVSGTVFSGPTGVIAFIAFVVGMGLVGASAHFAIEIADKGIEFWRRKETSKADPKQADWRAE